MRRLGVVFAVALSLVGTVVPPAEGAFEGINGRFAGALNQLFVVNVDGSGHTVISKGKGDKAYAQWSPDGRRILHQRGSHWAVTNQDGTWFRRVGPYPYIATFPSWAPDGRKFVYTTGNSLVIRNLRGEVVREIDTESWMLAPVWNPRGGRIVFYGDRNYNTCGSTSTWDVWSVRPNGKGLRRLTDTNAKEFVHDISPDGRRILFTREPCNDDPGLYTMRMDGSDIRLVTERGPYFGIWSPDGKTILTGDSCFVDPRGRNRRCVEGLSGVTDWQPVHPTEKGWVRGKVMTLTTYDGETGEVVAKALWVKGRASTTHEGIGVVAILYRRAGGTWTRFDRRADGTDGDGGYLIGLEPPRGRCKLVVRFRGDTEHRSARMEKVFRCRSVPEGDPFA